MGSRGKLRSRKEGLKGKTSFNRVPRYWGLGLDITILVCLCACVLLCLCACLLVCLSICPLRRGCMILLSIKRRRMRMAPEFQYCSFA